MLRFQTGRLATWTAFRTETGTAFRTETGKMIVGDAQILPNRIREAKSDQIFTKTRVRRLCQIGNVTFLADKEFLDLEPATILKAESLYTSSKGSSLPFIEGGRGHVAEVDVAGVGRTAVAKG